MGLTWAQLTWARPADQAEVVVSKRDCVAAGVDGTAGVVDADSVAGHDVEAPVHAHPDLPPSGEGMAMLVKCSRANVLALAGATRPRVLVPRQRCQQVVQAPHLAQVRPSATLLLALQERPHAGAKLLLKGVEQVGAVDLADRLQVGGCHGVLCGARGAMTQAATAIDKMR